VNKHTQQFARGTERLMLAGYGGLDSHADDDGDDDDSDAGFMFFCYACVNVIITSGLALTSSTDRETPVSGQDRPPSVIVRVEKSMGLLLKPTEMENGGGV
jgi:hypothetical protein